MTIPTVCYIFFWYLSQICLVIFTSSFLPQSWIFFKLSTETNLYPSSLIIIASTLLLAIHFLPSISWSYSCSASSTFYFYKIEVHSQHLGSWITSVHTHCLSSSLRFFIFSFFGSKSISQLWGMLVAKITRVKCEIFQAWGPAISRIHLFLFTDGWILLLSH